MIASYAYYHLDTQVMSDYDFDFLTVRRFCLTKNGAEIRKPSTFPFMHNRRSDMQG